LEQVPKGEWVGTNFSNNGWIGIASKFKELTEKSYHKTKFKNKFDNLRIEWRVWYKLFGKYVQDAWIFNHALITPNMNFSHLSQGIIFFLSL